MTRVVLLLIVLSLVSGCADEPILRHDDGHTPVSGEATPAPQTGPRGGWAW
jgi:uncharacterized protein YceK